MTMTILLNNFFSKTERVFDSKLADSKWDNIGTTNFAKLYVNVPIADKMGRKPGTPFLKGL